MDPPSSSSPRTDDAAHQDDDIEQIASHMDWDNEHDVGKKSRDEESNDISVESGDEQGPRIGQGCLGRKQVAARERQSGEAFD